MKDNIAYSLTRCLSVMDTSAECFYFCILSLSELYLHVIFGIISRNSARVQYSFDAFQVLSIGSMLHYFIRLVDQSSLVRVPLEPGILSDALTPHQQVSISDVLELFFIQNASVPHSVVIHQSKFEQYSTSSLTLTLSIDSIFEQKVVTSLHWLIQFKIRSRNLTTLLFE